MFPPEFRGSITSITKKLTRAVDKIRPASKDIYLKARSVGSNTRKLIKEIGQGRYKIALLAAMAIIVLAAGLTMNAVADDRKAKPFVAVSHNVTLSGKVLMTDGAAPPATLSVFNRSDKVAEQKVNPDGAFSISLTPGITYTVVALKDDYVAYQNTCYLDHDQSLEIQLTRASIPADNTMASVAPAATQASASVNTQAAKPAATSTPKPKSKTSSVKNAPAASFDANLTAILEQMNIARAASGLGKVVLNSSLSSAALAKAKDMNDKGYFAHTAPDGTNDFYFLNNTGYPWTSAGINLAMGDFGGAKGLVDGWMASPGHKANILASYGRQIGIGICGQYYVMMIAN